MKTVYLCGAINGCTDAECKDWRKSAKAKLSEDFHIFDPMRRDYRGIEHLAVCQIVRGDYEDIKRADIILAMADRPSWGTAMEIHQSFQALKEVVVVCGQERVSPWLLYHATAFFRTLDDAIEHILSLR